MVLAVLLLLFYIPSSYNLSFLVDLHTNFIYTFIVKILTYLQLDFESFAHSIMLTNHFRVDIVDDCNALLPLLFFLAAILITPTSVGKKVLWILSGWVAIMLFNIIRIVLIILITDQNSAWFFMAHDFSTFILMPLFIIILYWYFLKKTDNLN